MGFLQRTILALIYLCFIFLGFYLIVWVLGMLGIALPYMVLNVLKVILVLVAILVLLRLFAPWAAGWRWWPPAA